MSSEALNWAKSVTVGSACKKAVLLVLADYADHEWSCFPSQATIAAQAEVGERTVRRILADWEDQGVIHRTHRKARDGRGRSSDRIYLLPAALAGRTHDQPASHDDQPATGARPTGQAVAGEPLEEPVEEPLSLVLAESPVVTNVDADFEMWWLEYPRGRRQEKAEAKAQYAKARKDIDAETLTVAVQAFARLMTAQGTEAKFIPYAHRWLKKRRWEDEPVEASSPFEPPPMRYG